MIERQYSSPISSPDFSTIASPVAMAIPSRPSQRPVMAMTAHRMAVIVGHGDTTARTGAKKKPAPMNHAEPALSDISTKRSHRGIDEGVFGPVVIVVSPFGNTVNGAVRRHGRNYPRGSGSARLSHPNCCV